MRVLILLLILMSSCVTERKREKICATCPQVVTITKRDSIVNRDSIIYTPSLTLRDTIKIECDENRVPIISMSRPVKKGNARMEITRPDLNTLVSECIIDSMAVHIAWQEKHVLTERNEVIRERDPKPYIFLWVILALVIALLFALRKKNLTDL